ncbi:MAG: sulfotransferase [Verrucomicrobia bacterium]|nr:sulfotransferase [Verrucomicrobiota bacterium]
MYLNIGLASKALFHSYLGQPFRLRRWVIVAAFMLLLTSFWMVVAIGRALDHLLFPGFKRQVIHQPVFIIAPPRSGTTFLQKLLARNREIFAPVLMYQTIFPSITLQKIIQGIAGLSQKKDGLLGGLIGWVERHFFGGWDNMHKMRFNQPEEDDGFFVYTFVTEAIYLLFPYVRLLWGAGFADDLPLPQRRRVMRYYRSCLQRHLYLNGPKKTLLSKATQLSGSVASLREEFPDARIVNILRNPAESIASHVSVFYPVWKWVNPEITKKSRESFEYAELATAWFRHLEMKDDRADPRRYYRILYRDLVSKTGATVRSIYRHFKIPLSPAAVRQIAQAARQSLDYKSTHKYSLREFGLSADWLRHELGPMMKKHGFSITPRRSAGNRNR